MRADDPRHGSRTGYRAGCRCPDCRAACARYMAERRKRQYLERSDHLTVPSVGIHRRIQALVALGWSLSEISRRAGYDRSHVPLMLTRQGPQQRETSDRIKALYAELSMRLPPETNKAERINASRARNMAARNGWAPPLAWDDIDNPNETPSAAYQPRPDGANTGHEPHDEAAVLRILGGDWRLPCTVADKREVVARWTLRDPTRNSRGVHENEWDRPSYAYLERLTGWRIDRYMPRGDAA